MHVYAVVVVCFSSRGQSDKKNMGRWGGTRAGGRGDAIQSHLRKFLRLEKKLVKFWNIPALAFLASADGCAVALGVRLQPLVPRGLQKIKCALPFGAFFTCADCCVLADNIHSLPNLALFQNLQCKFPTLTFFNRLSLKRGQGEPLS